MTVALIYHDVVEAARRDQVGFPTALAARYKLTPSQFERHLDAIAATGARVGLLTAGAEHPDGAAGLAPSGTDPDVALTFDDGGLSAVAIATALERRGWRGHFFVTTGRIGTAGFLDAEAIRALLARGHAVGSHSHTHPTYMGRLSRAELLREWQLSRETLAELIGEAPTSAAVPGGFLSSAVISTAAQAGYRLLMTSEPIRRTTVRDGMRVVGRYTIWAATPAATATAYVRGSWPARGRSWLAWRTKDAAKRISPAAYQRVRALRTSSRSGS